VPQRVWKILELHPQQSYIFVREPLSPVLLALAEEPDALGRLNRQHPAPYKFSQKDPCDRYLFLVDTL
ncbi:MAG TPA: hypothetical protein VJZ94_00220, partial [Candidatus Paceibacterota bacterium]|nr:hypothetical protein [Candidatus Paceibacterota bacterium]